MQMALPPADYVAPFSPPASMAVQKVKVPNNGNRVEPQATGLRATLVGRVRVERLHPPVKTGPGQGRGGSSCCPPPPSQQPQHLPELPHLGCSQPGQLWTL